VLGRDWPELQLASGETRLLAVDVEALPAHTIRLVGPSRELLPHLEVMCSVSEHQRGPSVRLDGEGRAVVRGYEPPRLHYSLATRTAWSTLHPRTGPGPDFELEPGQPLRGLCLLGAEGARVPFNLGLEPGECDLRYVGPPALVQVIEATALP